MAAFHFLLCLTSFVFAVALSLPIDATRPLLNLLSVVGKHQYGPSSGGAGDIAGSDSS